MARIAPRAASRAPAFARLQPATIRPGNRNSGAPMQNHTVETLIGAVVVAVAVFFLYFAYSSTSSANLSGYDIDAKFQRVDGLNVGTDVRLSGIKIGSISSLTLDPKTYQATAHLSIKSDVKLPDDASVMVTSTGLLGNSYLSISPGGSDTMITP